MRHQTARALSMMIAHNIAETIAIAISDKARRRSASFEAVKDIHPSFIFYRHNGRSVVHQTRRYDERDRFIRLPACR